MILLNFRSIGSLVAVYFSDFEVRIGLHFHPEPQFGPAQYTAHPYNGAIQKLNIRGYIHRSADILGSGHLS